MRSIMQEDPDICYLCGKPAGATPQGYMDRLEWHHVFEGNPDRKLSERYGLKVRLHGITCHREGPGSVHKNRRVYLAVMAAGQKAFEQEHGTREDFVRIFRKNYL